MPGLRTGPWRLVTVEMLVVDIDGRALVASLEVVA
jgi:hypothetical protein